MLYILLGTLTDAGQQRMSTNPELFNEACSDATAPGVQLLARYAVLGRFDLVVLADAVDHEAIVRLSLELGARAAVHFETLPAIGIGHLGERDDEPVPGLQRARALDEPQESSLN